MSDRKPGIFTRLKRVISSTVNDAVDAVSDPGQEIALMLDDLASQIKAAEKDLRQAIVDRKVMEKKIESQTKDRDDWAARAQQAVKLGDDDLARAALSRKNDIQAQLDQNQAALAEQQDMVVRMQVDIEKAKNKHKALDMRRGSLMAQARAQKQADQTGLSSSASAGGTRLDAIEDKITQLEAMNEAMAETRAGEVEAARVDAQLAQLEGTSELDDELAALKAKLAADQKALGEGEA